MEWQVRDANGGVDVGQSRVVLEAMVGSVAVIYLC